MSRPAPDKTPFLQAVKREYGDVTVVSRVQVTDIMSKYRLKLPVWLTNDPAVRAGRGLYSLMPFLDSKNDAPRQPKPPRASRTPAPVAAPVAVAAPALVENEASIAALTAAMQSLSLVPARAEGYVPFGHYADVRTIIKSGKFYPTYVTGLSGNGKTMMIEQVCAQESRELVRANITRETDEDDLLGGFRLIDGKTVWQNGPVIVAMERGAILLLDEVDLGDSKLMCLQPILEGKPFYLKKINRVISPAPGFNVLATANTKGKGSDDGRFIGTNVMNEAFLERFSITFEQEYPGTRTEAKILKNVLEASKASDDDFVEKLVNWADMIRKAFYDGAVSDIISTRRLVHICEAFAIFGQSREKAIRLCLNRFDVDTKNGFFDLYAKLDESILPAKQDSSEEVTNSGDNTEISF